MIEKIKAFFNKKIAKIIGGIAIEIAALALIICGIASKDIIPKITTVIVGVLATSAGAITIIKGIKTEEEQP
jgi:hypothetical protein